MQLSLYRDARGFRRADVSEPCQVLGWFLEQDVQGSVQFAEELIATIDAVEHGDAPSWEGTGNAHTLTIYADHARIENEYTDEAGSVCELSLAELKSALMAWIAFLEQLRAEQ